jgi:hypothetical protein
MKELKNVYLLSFLIIVIFFLSADKKIEKLIKKNMYILLIILLCIIFLIYNKINTQLFILIIIGSLYYISELKDKYNYEYFTSKFENASVQTLKDKLINLSEFYTDNDSETDNESNNRDEVDNNNIMDDNDDDNDDLKELFKEVDNEIMNLKNIQNDN